MRMSDWSSDVCSSDLVSADSNEPARSRLAAGGFEIPPVDDVARAAWDAVHGERVHVPVGKMAKRLSRLARYFPGLIAKQSKKLHGLGSSGRWLDALETRYSKRVAFPLAHHEIRRAAGTANRGKKVY